MTNTTTRVKRVVNIPTSTGGEWINPADNPQAANEAIDKLMAEVNTTKLPEISLPSDDTVTLPGGLVIKDKVIREVQVKELTGEDEEALARASQSQNPLIFLDRLIKCGVVKIGSEPTSENDKLLNQMLIGDREAIILGIRKVTYGASLDVEEWICPKCGSKADLEMTLDDIPVITSSDPLNDQGFEVDLRKGGKAYVNLATGADQLAIFEKPDLTQAQRETILLTRCVKTLMDENGKELPMAAFPSLARSMSIPDRHAILKELKDRQPGPKYDKIAYTCQVCETEQNVLVTIGHLFLDFGWV